MTSQHKSLLRRIKCRLGFHKALKGKYSEKSIPSDCWCLGCGKLLYFTLIKNGVEIKNRSQWT